jgi:hypothetical protein
VGAVFRRSSAAPKIERLSPVSTQWSTYFAPTTGSTTHDFAFDPAGSLYGLDEFGGLYSANVATQTYSYVDSKAWKALKMTPGAAVTQHYEIVATGQALYGLKRSECSTQAPMTKVAIFDRTNATAPKAIDLPDGGGDLVVGSTELTVQSWCDGTVTRVDPSTGGRAYYARPRVNPNPQFPQYDLDEWQFRWPLGADGNFVYFLHGKTIRRVPRH